MKTCHVCKRETLVITHRKRNGLYLCDGCNENIRKMKRGLIVVVMTILISLTLVNTSYAKLYLGPEDYNKNCEGVLSQSLIGSHTCNELVTNDGHSLTNEGVNVFGCLGPTALQGIFGSDLSTTIQNNADECGGTYPGNSNGNHGFMGTNKPLIDLSGNNGDSVAKGIYCKIFC